jgi:autotransporter-associated beta strand protein
MVSQIRRKTSICGRMSAVRSRSGPRMAIAAAMAVGFLPAALLAQSTWTTTTTGTTNWSAATWTGGVPTSGTTTAVTFFVDPTSLGNGTITAANDLSPNPFVLNSLTVNGTGPSGANSSVLTIQGNGLQFGGTSPSIVLNPVYGSGGGSTVNLNTPLNFSANTSMSFGTGGGFINTTGVWSGSGTVSFSGSYTNRALSIPTSTSFAGDLNITGANSVVGVTNVNNSIGSNSGAGNLQSVVVGSGSGMNINYGDGAYTHPQNFVLNGAGNSASNSAALNITRINFGNGTIGGLSVASDATIRTAPQNTNESRAVSITRGLVGTGKLTKLGTGYLIPTASVPASPVTWGGTSYSAFTGDVDIREGVIQTTINVSNQLGTNSSGAQLVTVFAGASFVHNSGDNSSTQPQNFVLNGTGTGVIANLGGFNALASFDVGFGSNTARSIVVASDASLGATKRSGRGNIGFSTSSGWAGSGTLSIGPAYGANAGTVFANQPAATVGSYGAFSGRVVLNSGMLNVGDATALGASSSGQVFLSANGALGSSLVGGIDQAFLGRLANAGTSSGVVALGVNTANNLDFTSAPNLRLGALAAYTYSGTITPGAAGYRLGGGSGNLTVSSPLTGNRSLTVDGIATLTSAANTFSGGITIAGTNIGADHGARLSFTGGAGVLPTNDVTFSAIGGTFAYTGAAAGSSQSMGALSFSQGQGSVTSTYGTSGNTSLDFSSMATRTAGAVGNFAVSGGSNGTTNKITLTGVGTGFIDKGIYFGGNGFAFYDAGGFVRAAVYGSDAGFVTVAGGASVASATHQQTTAALTAQTTATFTTFRMNGATTVTMVAGSVLTMDGLIKIGSTATLGLGDVGTIRASSNSELVVRTDAAADALTIGASVVSNGNSSLTKSGAGSVSMSSPTGSTYTGGTTILGGSFSVSGGGLADTGAILVNGGAYNVNVADTVGAVRLRNGVIGGSSTLTGSSYAVENGQINTVLGGSGVALTKSTGGLVTITNASTYTGNTVIQGGKLTYVSASSTYPLASNLIVVGDSVANNSAALDVLSVSRGFTVPTGKTLAGHGLVLGNVSFASGSTLSPGTSTGVLTMNGNLSLAAGSSFAVELAGTSATPVAGVNFDQVAVNGSLSIGSSTLALSYLGFAPTVVGGELFFIARNDGTDAISGTFAGLPQGSMVTVGAYSFLVSYLGNAESVTPSFLGGNDVVLQVQPIPEPSAMIAIALMAPALLRRCSNRLV